MGNDALIFTSEDMEEAERLGYRIGLQDAFFAASEYSNVGDALAAIEALMAEEDE